MIRGVSYVPKTYERIEARVFGERTNKRLSVTGKFRQYLSLQFGFFTIACRIGILSYVQEIILHWVPG